MIVSDFLKAILNFLFTWITSFIKKRVRRPEKRKIDDRNLFQKKNLKLFEQNIVLNNNINYYSPQQQQNCFFFNENEISPLINQGNHGVSLYKKGNIKESKNILLPVCEKIFNSYKAKPNPILKEILDNFLKITEEIDTKLKSTPMQKEALKYDSKILEIIHEAKIDRNKTNVKFDDIIGLDKEKEIFNECLIYPFLRPDLFKGIRSPPRGILLYGPPGNGKTLFAKAIANECHATFFNLSASNLISKYCGESEKIMKCLFNFASQNEPSIIFIDEVDSILTTRNESEHEASRRLKTEFLIQFDGLGTSDQMKIYVICATNRPQELDPAALRRLTKRIYIGMPTPKAIQNLLLNNLKNVKHSISEEEIKNLSENMKGYSCSDIKAICKEACMQPIRKIKGNNFSLIQEDSIKPVEAADFRKAISSISPSVSSAEIENYDNYNKCFAKK